jgi:outer membrane protein OmpA-like peptidoglycan-associated protein
MKTAFGLAFVVLALASTASAQSSGGLMRESQVSEGRLIEALLPKPGAGAGIVGATAEAEAGSDASLPPGVRSRSIKVMPSAGAVARPASAAAKPSSAALLITFETNSAELTPAARSSLDVVAKALNNERLSGLTFSIEGHADVRGNGDENLRLSQARAESVKQYLVASRNVSPDRLKAVGRGDREPMNKQEVSAPENRRVTFVTQQ